VKKDLKVVFLFWGKMQIKVGKLISLLLLVGTIIMYVGWSVSYNDWGDIGVYSFCAFFGVLAILLFLISRE